MAKKTLPHWAWLVLLGLLLLGSDAVLSHIPAGAQEPSDDMDFVGSTVVVHNHIPDVSIAPSIAPQECPLCKTLTNPRLIAIEVNGHEYYSKPTMVYCPRCGTVFVDIGQR